MRIGFIGYGEAAYNMATGFKDEGLKDIIAYDTMQNDVTRGELIQKTAKQANVKLVQDALEVVNLSDIIFIAVPSVYSLDVCRQIKSELDGKKIYADLSASTPTVKNQIWEEIKDTGVLFADAAMMGSLPKDKHKVPITASGNGAEKLKSLMAPYNMAITTAGTEPGAASAIKLIRSIFMKGIATLMIEMLQAAKEYDVVDQVVGSISKSMDNTPFTSHLDRLVIGSAIHCKRRADELKGSIDMLEEASIDSSMTKASKGRLQALEYYDFQGRYIDEAPKNWEEVIEVINHSKGGEIV